MDNKVNCSLYNKRPGVHVCVGQRGQVQLMILRACFPIALLQTIGTLRFRLLRVHARRGIQGRRHYLSLNKPHNFQAWSTNLVENSFVMFFFMMAHASCCPLSDSSRTDTNPKPDP